MSTTVHRGSCLCGGVVYEVEGPLRDVIGCHCGQCRKQTGHFMAATAARHTDFKVVKQDDLKWYTSSDFAERAFCGTCGSTLFWQRKGGDYIAIAAGTLDTPTGIRIEGHIFCADKGDYYEILDGDYQRAQWLAGD